MCAALLIVFYCLQLNYTRPGLPKLNPRLLENWKNEVKEKGRINCPNNVRTSLFFSRLAGLSLQEEGESFGGINPPKPGSFWARHEASIDAQTLVSPLSLGLLPCLVEACPTFGTLRVCSNHQAWGPDHPLPRCP